jgi:hypothetical protein
MLAVGTGVSAKGIMDSLLKKGHVHHELNYLISEEVALRLRDFVREYLDLNEYSVARPNFSFPVHSLYLDSPDLELYRKARNDLEHRCQLRIRFHDDRPASPVFLEIKRRAVDVVARQRCAASREAIGFVLGGEMPPHDLLIDPSPRSLLAIEDFMELTRRLQASPQVRLSFLREAYVSDDEGVQVTFDRQIVFEPCREPVLQCEMEAPQPLFAPHVLFELNFIEHYPKWFREMVQHFNLTECGVDKFVGAVASLQDDDLTRTLRGPF